MADEGERLQKVLARLGVASRRGVEELIRQGRVEVDGEPAVLGMRLVGGEEVRVDGEPVVGTRSSVTYMLNKPRGVVSTASDERGRRTVVDLLPATPGLHPVGRLDRESEGLLLLTTDGDLTLRLTHPRYGHRKTYRVWCRQGSLPQAALARLLRGVELEDGPARAVEARALPEGCELVLGEGRKRQVRRMLAALGFDVTRLVRTRVGELDLGDLEPGRYRLLDEEEIEAALATGEQP